MAVRWPYGGNPTDGLLTPERTDVIETAVACGWPLDWLCPHPACELGGVPCLAITADPPYIDDIVIFEFHPCGHRFWPQWRIPERKPSPHLDHPVSRKRARWWNLAAYRRSAP